MTIETRKQAVALCRASFNLSASAMNAAGALIQSESKLRGLLTVFNAVANSFLAARPSVLQETAALTKIDPSFPYVMTDVDKAAVSSLADQLGSVIKGFEANTELRVHSATVDLAGKVTVTLW